MFSSNHFPCSTNIFSPDSFFEHEQSNLHFNYHQPTNNTFIFQQQFSNGSGLQYYYDHDQDDLLHSIVSPINKKMPTLIKDGVNNKIHTTRGPRDRRVRLSIEIAKKFFYLQDLLGFDKPSKTLDWLLTKSLTSIKDLVEETVVSDQSREKFLETIMGDAHEESGPRKKKMTQRCKGGLQDDFLRCKSRIEARSRARERTKEKLRVKKCVDQESWKMCKDSSFLIGGFMGDHVVNDLDLE